VDVVILLVFISLILVLGGLLFFLTRLRAGDFDHGERLSLLPLAEETPMGEDDSPATASVHRDSVSKRDTTCNGRDSTSKEGGNLYGSQ